MSKYDGWVATLSGVGANTFGQPVPLDRAIGGAAVVHVSRIDSGQVQFVGTVDGETWSLVLAENLATRAFVTSTTTSGMFRLEATGLAALATPLYGWSSGVVRSRVLPQNG